MTKRVYNRGIYLGKSIKIPGPNGLSMGIDLKIHLLVPGIIALHAS